MNITETYESMGVDPKIYNLGEEVLKDCKDAFDRIDKLAEMNQLKVLNAFRKNQVSEACLHGTTGYGYNDFGRDTLEAVYADIFHTEDALVRPQITCGTHAIALALFSNLRPGDELLAPAGRLYDTMDEVIGLRDSKGSHKEYGVTYKQVNLTADGGFDYEGIKNALTDKTKIVHIQRSKGYEPRKTFSVEEIGNLIKFIKGIKPDVIAFVDNCYGEFTEAIEPTDVGADMCAGSLIKNPGGGLAPIGGYIAGNKECIENAAARLTSPGLGKEVGASLEVMRSLYQGIFLAPTVSASAVKGALFAAGIYEHFGFKVVPSFAEKERHDIIQSIVFNDANKLIAFCKGIQAASPVDSFVKPEPSDMPGYDSKVIMAAGTFVSGASIELSADGPLRAPYAAYFQGGITWPHVKFGILNTVSELYKENLVSL
ncbi:MAG: methionine gamma-lyase family protein [Lachnospiraceae bacterium]|nr:methionine gamma-lyase family protein [Lachnospiraceae bacterium]